MRFLSLVLLLVVALAAGRASAQSTDTVPPAWGAAPVAVDAVEMPLPATHHVVREKLLMTGIVFLGIGYVGSIVLGSTYLATLGLGPLSCNDQYAGWQFVPIVGPVVGMLAGASCIHDNLHFEEGLFPVVLSLTQIAGLIMTIVGALGRDVPQVSFVADANGGYATLRGTF